MNIEQVWSGSVGLIGRLLHDDVDDDDDVDPDVISDDDDDGQVPMIREHKPDFDPDIRRHKS